MCSTRRLGPADEPPTEAADRDAESCAASKFEDGIATPTLFGGARYDHREQDRDERGRDPVVESALDVERPADAEREPRGW